MLNSCLNGAYWIFFELPHEPHHNGLFECGKAISIACMHLHIFNFNGWAPCCCRTCIPSPVTSLVLERVFTFGQSLQPRACDAFKATKPVEPRVAHFELLLCWQKLTTTNSLQNHVNNAKNHKRPHFLRECDLILEPLWIVLECFVSFLALSLSTSLARTPPCTWSTWSSRPPTMETMTPSEWSFW